MKLRQFSVHNILSRTQAVVKRFPLAVLACLAGTIAGIVFIHNPDSEIIPNILLTLSFAAPVFVALVLIVSAKKIDRTKELVASGIILAALVGYYFLLPAIGEGHADTYIRHFMWAVGFIFLITFVPFTLEKGKKTIQAFWQYNRTLVFSVVLTGIWVFALQAGVSIALASIDFLFEIRIDEERYAELWVFLVGTFAPLFFLNRLPEHPEKQNTDTEFPKEVRLFSQFVLVPLVTVYFLILYAYSIRILLTTEWPEGQLAYMILGFSFLGVLTYLALYPLRDSVEWIRKAGNVLFAAMIPQVGMLFWALWFRVSQYGITENRYFVFVFGCWLLGVAVYYLVSKLKDIRIIPATLFLLAFLTSFGPWGAFAVSERSQVDRLESLLIESEILVDGKVEKLSAAQDDELDFEDKKEISAGVRYLYDVHGLDGIQSWFDEDLGIYSDEEEGKYRSGDEQVVEDLMGVTYVNRWESFIDREIAFEENGYFNASVGHDQAGVLSTAGHDYFLQVYAWRGPGDLDESEFNLTLSNNQQGFVLMRDNEVVIEVSLQAFLADLDATGESASFLPRDMMRVEFSSEQIDGLFYIEDVSGEINDEIYELSNVSGLLLFSLKE